MKPIEVTHFTKRLVLEPLTKQHASKLFEGFSSPKLYEYIPQNPPASMTELETRYAHLEKRTSPDGGSLWLNWACRLIASDIYIGLVEVTLDIDSIDAALAYFIFSDHQHLGYAREACEAVLEHIFRDYEAVSSTSEIDDLNEASIALVHRLGFQKLGDSRAVTPYKGKTHSEGRYSITRERWMSRST
jgi:RimJ/RimL family protein N-acetyltransferase